MNSIVLAICKKAKLSKEAGTGRELPGCYEGLSCTDLQEVVGALGELFDWKAACSRNNCSAGKFLTVTGNESTMKITRQKLGPF